MICTSKGQAEAVAKAGFNKMVASGEYSTLPPFNEGDPYFVCKNDEETFYRVDVYTDRMVCACPFYKENKQFGVCKHVLYVADELATLAAEEAHEAAQPTADEYADFTEVANF